MINELGKQLGTDAEDEDKRQHQAAVEEERIQHETEGALQSIIIDDHTQPYTRSPRDYLSPYAAQLKILRSTSSSSQHGPYSNTGNDATPKQPARVQPH